MPPKSATLPITHFHDKTAYNFAKILRQIEFFFTPTFLAGLYVFASLIGSLLSDQQPSVPLLRQGSNLPERATSGLSGWTD